MGLANLHAIVHRVGMTTERTEGRQAAMNEAFETLTAATIRLDAAHERVAIAELARDAIVPQAPLRYKVAATARVRDARIELATAEAAYDAAQDEPAPEE